MKDLEKNGEYSVRSAYRAICGECLDENEAASSGNSSLRNKIWNANPLPRIKIFFKRACRGAFPTSVELGKRIQSHDVVCSLCKAAEETVLHCLRDCVVAKLIWEECELDLGRGERNRWIFEGEACNPTQSMEYVLKLVKEMQKEDNVGIGGSSSTRQKWKLPPEGLCKLNVDGGSLEEGDASAGAVVRDAAGVVKMAAAWRVEECWEPAIAEAKAMLLGLRAAMDCGHRKLEVESDCLSLFTAIKSRERGGSSLHLVLDDIYHVSGLLDFVSWSFTRREGNKVAHELAHCLSRDTSSRVWFSNFPSCIVSLLEFDLPMNES
uniref:RNase H type-1 domain-containing protein n=1 Tax=Chenopodium quinoa TaxID=63459 RepID=A0A803N2H0_CHEQI